MSGVSLDPSTTASGGVTAQIVADVAIHPGESSTDDRTWGGPKASSKVALTANGSVKGSAGYYYGFIVTTVTATAAITVYDNTSASGTIIDIIPTATAAGAHFLLPVPVPCSTGIFAQFGSATGTVLFLYS